MKIHITSKSGETSLYSPLELANEFVKTDYCTKYKNGYYTELIEAVFIFITKGLNSSFENKHLEHGTQFYRNLEKEVYKKGFSLGGGLE